MARQETRRFHRFKSCLKGCLIERFKKKVKIRSLKLYDCYYLSKECIKELEEIVVNVAYTIRQSDISEYESS